jgi:uroporphyrinogen decarboxylase
MELGAFHRRSKFLNHKERIFAALGRKQVDRVPRCEFWIDALLHELGQKDVETAHVNLGQDSIMMPTRGLENSNAWKNGVDEWGRTWKDGMYVNGMIKGREDFRKYSVNSSRAAECFDVDRIAKIRTDYPEYCFMYGSHLGPFMGGYMAMGFEEFFIRVIEEPDFVFGILEDRTQWAISMLQKAVSLGAELLILGDDAAHKNAPMISPKMWRKFILPFHKQIVNSVPCPVIFHSDGNLMPVIPLIIEAGFVGLHGLEPAANMNLPLMKKEYGKDLVLVGNLDVGILAGNDLCAVRNEVERCLSEGAQGGGYMLATCNSIFNGLNAESVKEYFSYSQKLEY